MGRVQAGGLVTALLGLAAAPAAAQSDTSRPGTVFRDCRHCPEMVVVAAGSFLMGSTDEETARAGMAPEARLREQPAHTVTLARPFAVGRFEVTRREYADFASATRRDPGEVCLTWNQAESAWKDLRGASWRDPGFPQTDRDPVACVSYDDARDYAAWLSARTHHAYRLLSEAEWEYMARAGTVGADYWGDDAAAVCRNANVSDLAAAEVHPALRQEPDRLVSCRDGYVYTAPVGRFTANPFGIYDVIGNVWEWVADCYSPSYVDAPGDGSARVTVPCEKRVVRGGGWYAKNFFNRAAARSREDPASRMGTLGIRLARDLEPR